MVQWQWQVVLSSVLRALLPIRVTRFCLAWRWARPPAVAPRQGQHHAPSRCDLCQQPARASPTRRSNTRWASSAPHPRWSERRRGAQRITDKYAVYRVFKPFGPCRLSAAHEEVLGASRMLCRVSNIPSTGGSARCSRWRPCTIVYYNKNMIALLIRLRSLRSSGACRASAARS